MAKPKDISAELLAFDDDFRDGDKLLFGMDEAGRGPLAGPVVCACVGFSPGVSISYVNDSKKLSEKRREELFDIIKKEALCVGVGICDNHEIDSINILNATKSAMIHAVNSMDKRPDIILVDAVPLEIPGVECVPVIKGDAKSFAIAAASIIAKVTRDRIMADMDLQYPGYGFSKHKGYGTKAHYEAIRTLGFCEIHRRTFLKNLH